VKRLALVLAAAAACSSPAAPPAGRVVMVLTVDWEGVELSADGFAAIDALRGKLGGVPITHFVSAAYATRASRGDLAAAIDRGVHADDELAVHLHGWASLAQAASIAPRVSPSFFTGTDQLLQVVDGDTGFDLDLDAYDVPALRALLKTSRQILETSHHPVSTSFRAGGYLATPKLLLALGAEGIAVDSSAVDPRQLTGLDDDTLAKRLGALWPGVTPATQPFLAHGGALQSIVELPIAAIVDDVPRAELARLLDGARARLRANPGRDVFVVLAFHLETASDFLPQLADVLAKARDDRTIFVTADRAAELARFTLAPPAGSG